ncbi:hypothetical protein CMUS01_16176 [Colletotrichum musicola]|uniref:Nephrocystin 3-like N-terminal domain-containing protein n=1 Tax=Colletotrichum musicola TaxID=2175873 RepID=A0A8H6IQH8_9PEZI|nr:hypothetical protein CMUS01_16176 [Colletotrichum musicola]
MSSRSVLPSSSADPAGPSTGTVALRDPQPGLEHALLVFQANLTDDERTRLQRMKGSSCDADAVLRFTHDLDGVNPARRGKSIATRLYSLIQIAQQFYQIADTYVSSHPEIAALVWGSVKLTFLILANFTSYFEKFAELLRGFDQLCPRFAEYRRQHLLVSLTQSFQSEIQPHVIEIRSKARYVKDEIALAKALDDHKEHLLQAQERQQAAESRHKLANWFSQTDKGMSLRADERKWEKLLNKLSSYDHTEAFKNARAKKHNGTAEWIFRNQEYETWVQGPSSCALHIVGKIGSGKTIMTPFETLFLVLDGLDECPVVERTKLLSIVSQVFENCVGTVNLKLLFSSRESATEQVDELRIPLLRLDISSDTSQDLSTYTNDIVRQKISGRQLMTQDEELISDILETISKGGEGMSLAGSSSGPPLCGSGAARSPAALRSRDRDVRPDHLPP